MKTYKALKLFIATPGDLNRERNSFVEIITEVNRIKAHQVGYHLEPVGWEVTLPGNGRAQSIINKQIMGCDLFIMIFWEHWGSPTGKYSSGTEEEYYTAMHNYENIGTPEIWLFFKDSQVDSEDTKIIHDFRRKIEEERKLFYKSFNTLTDWENLLRQYLCQWIDELDRSKDDRIDDEVAINDKSDILIEISFQDYVYTDVKIRPTIYFTIKDEKSLANWTKMENIKKEKFLYDILSNNLGLTLGVELYYGTIRYKREDGLMILLGAITRKYEDSIELSKIHIQSNYTQLCKESPYEREYDGHIG